VQVRLLPEPILSTTGSTVLIPDEKEVIPSPSPIALNRKLEFPISTFDIIAKDTKCLRCKKSVEISGTDFFRCFSCGVSSKFSQLPVFITAKIKFPHYEEEITIFHNQLSQYCTKFGVSLAEDSVTESFLKNDKAVMVANYKNICVTFI